MVLLGPVDVDGAFTHGLECAFHADGADIDVAEHRRHEQHRNHGVNHLGILHGVDGGAVEREHQHVARDRDRGAAENDDPVDRLLAAVEAVGRRMIVADDAAAALEPLDIHLVRNVATDPHQEDQHNADGEGEAQIVVRVFRPFGPGRECFRAERGDKERPPEGNVEASDRPG